MTNEQLQELSRRAAGCLPKEWRLASSGLPFFVCYEAGMPDGAVNGYVSDHCRNPRKWLHESTEACSEIMVRVLWAKNVVIGGSVYPANVVVWGTTPPMFVTKEQIPDPMLAFRVAVLRALIALSEGK